MIKCSECKKSIIEETKYTDWLSIFNFFEFLRNEGYIEAATCEDMMGKLQTLKVFAFEEEEKWDCSQL